MAETDSKVALEPRTFKVTGMTCNACVNSVERSLNGMPGVSATVNFAAETAHTGPRCHGPCPRRNDGRAGSAGRGCSVPGRNAGSLRGPANGRAGSGSCAGCVRAQIVRHSRAMACRPGNRRNKGGK